MSIHRNYKHRTNYTSDIKDIDVLTEADMTFKLWRCGFAYSRFSATFCRISACSVNQVVVEVG